MFRKILIPIDGSDTAQRGLQEGIQLARDGGATIRLMHVVDELTFIRGLESYAAQRVDLLAKMRGEGSRILQQAAEQVRAAGIAVEEVFVDSFAERLEDKVADEAAKWPADLIVIGSHGRRGVQRLLLGSDAERILRRAPVPVLVVRGPEAQAS